MVRNAREEILGKLRAAPKREVSVRPEMSPLNEVALDREQMIAKFTETLFLQTGIVHRVKDNHEALDKLREIAEAEGLKRVVVSTDDVIAPLDLPSWGEQNGVHVSRARDFKDRNEFKDEVFARAEAGITGADFAVAESGTLGLVHDADQARLISLAPILHIALVPVERFVPVYESAINKIFENGDTLPSQFTFITGPSMTADIQATPFRGMHGPRRIIVILIG
jgi:L-lactate dehydrogenase complex protein LldG